MSAPEVRKRTPEVRSRQILDAALTIFGEQGLAGARIDDIAERAGISKGTVYLYFASKDDLFREVTRDAFREVLASVDHLSSLPTAAEQLAGFCRSYWKSVRSPRFETVFRLTMAEIHRFPELSREYSEEVREPIKQIVAGILDRGVQNGEFEPDDNQTRARMLIALLWQHGLWCAKRQFIPDLASRSDDEVLNDVITFFLGAVATN